MVEITSEPAVAGAGLKEREASLEAPLVNDCWPPSQHDSAMPASLSTMLQGWPLRRVPAKGAGGAGSRCIFAISRIGVRLVGGLCAPKNFRVLIRATYLQGKKRVRGHYLQARRYNCIIKDGEEPPRLTVGDKPRPYDMVLAEPQPHPAAFYLGRARESLC